jgi:hypothetical protein
VPKVGQWGQLCVRVVRYNKFTIKSNYPNPTRLELLTNDYTSLQSLQKDVQEDTRYTRYEQEINKSHPRAKHAPSGTYSTWTAFTGI